MKVAIAVVVSVLATILVLVQPGLAVECGQVDASMAPCISFLTGKADAPSAACCNGVKAVKGMSQTSSDKQATCSCLKAAAMKYTDLKDTVAQSLPTKCNVQLDVPISRTVDCSKLAVLNTVKTVTCGQVDGSVAPCIPFLTGKADAPSPTCCAGVRAVKGMAQSKDDKQATCSCLKAAAIRYTDLKDTVAQTLPSKCNVQLDVPISRTVDCSKIALLNPVKIVTCGQVDSSVAPCIPFLTGKADAPSPTCCAGVKAVKGMAQSKDDKQATCSCLKAAAIRYTDLKDTVAQTLPSKCNVQLDVPISRTVDCTKLAFFNPVETVTCGQVDSSVAPCIPFLTGKADAPTPTCCAGVRAVKGMAQSKDDKQATCSCLKAAAIRYTDLKDTVAQTLPSKCNVQLDVPISRTVDCTKLAFFNPVETVTCGQVDSSVAPCIPFLTGRADTPSPMCCAGVRAVKGMAQSKDDKQATCSCLKQAAIRYTDLKDTVAQTLPAKCNVQLDVPISRTVDCTKLTYYA